MKKQIEQNSKFVHNLKELKKNFGIKPLSLNPENIEYYAKNYPDFEIYFRQKTLHRGKRGVQGSTNLYL